MSRHRRDNPRHAQPRRPFWTRLADTARTIGSLAYAITAVIRLEDLL